MKSSDFSYKIERWFELNQRSLPWRNTKDPYRIWISEIILQQTRVSQGYDYFLRFMERFPTVEALAAATEDEVLRLWQGLGYYSRARNLHAAAQTVVASGGFPTDYAGIRALKGVGDYTAAAIASFAYDLPCAVVDGNVYRVLARHFGLSEPIDTTSGKKLFAAMASECLDEKNPALYNQAIMDFGAVQCSPQSPRCAACPLSETCVALAENHVADWPVKSKKTKVTERYLVYVKVVSKGQMLLHRRDGKDIWKGLYEPLLLEFPHHPSENEVLKSSSLQPFLQGKHQFLPCVSGMLHVLSHRRLITDYYLLETESSFCPDGYQFVPVSSLSDYAFPRLVLRLFESEK